MSKYAMIIKESTGEVTWSGYASSNYPQVDWDEQLVVFDEDAGTYKVFNCINELVHDCMAVRSINQLICYDYNNNWEPIVHEFEFNDSVPVMSSLVVLYNSKYQMYVLVPKGTKLLEFWEELSQIKRVFYSKGYYFLYGTVGIKYMIDERTMKKYNNIDGNPYEIIGIIRRFTPDKGNIYSIVYVGEDYTQEKHPLTLA